MLAGFSTPLAAADLERLVMPGKLIDGHARYEADCRQCHVRFEKQTQGRLCLDCHEQVAGDIGKQQGHHGRLRKNGTDIENCKACHSDHLGRRADIVKLDADRFDHRLTDFPLRGAHQGAACSGCHAGGKAFRDTPIACNDCHQSDDAHRGGLGQACHDCHTASRWSEPRFDHDKTDFPLAGGHKEAACNSCHPDQRYQPTPKTCIACHGLNDRHAGRYGTRCDSCHGTDQWQTVYFDHGKDTDFVLQGRHRDVACTACHAENPYRQQTPTRCHDCHQDNDQHKGRYGKACQDCHSEQGWSRTRFDHARDTRFNLRGRHQDLLCTACHKGPAADAGKTTACNDCHQADDVHQGQQGRDCARCHDEQGWGGKLRFDHGLTRLPLIGLHAVAPCEECHLSTDFKQAPTACSDCHQADDVHKGRLPDDCGQCHNPNAWSLWRFDHDATDFKLDGAHRGLDCLACHRETVKAETKPEKACLACHAGEDKHRGRFGKDCERCHDTQAFDRISWPE